MELTKLSATAMEVAETCLSRFAANQIAGRGAEQKGYAAKVGSACHGALEHFVKTCVMKAEYSYEFKTLEIFLMHSFQEEFGHLDTGSKEYKDCLDLLKRWYDRTSFEGVTVLSAEQYLSFQVPTSVKPIPFNFIIDRLDILDNDEPGTYRIVDYKTLGNPLTPAQLDRKLQALIYAIAVSIQYKDSDNPPKKIRVVFDMLRHDTTVGTMFSRDELVAGWERIRAACERVISTPQEKALQSETINPECGFCIKKTTCSALKRNSEAGGVHSYGSIEEMIDARALMKMQAKALNDALKEIDPVIMANLENEDQLTSKTQFVTAAIKTRSERKIDPEMFRHVVGEVLFKRFGSYAVNIAAIDEFLKDDSIPENLRNEVGDMLTREVTGVYLDTKPIGRARK